jgi:hypothetical protein
MTVEELEQRWAEAMRAERHGEADEMRRMMDAAADVPLEIPT